MLVFLVCIHKVDMLFFLLYSWTRVIFYVALVLYSYWFTCNLPVKFWHYKPFFAAIGSTSGNIYTAILPVESKKIAWKACWLLYKVHLLIFFFLSLFWICRFVNMLRHVPLFSPLSLGHIVSLPFYMSTFLHLLSQEYGISEIF